MHEREEYHEYLVASDELEILGYFLENGSLQSLNAKKDNMVGFSPDFSAVFDDIYFEKRGITRKHSNPELRQNAINKSTSKAKSKGAKKKKRNQSRDSKKKNRKK
ncbi:hypothetical protein [Peribacillus frigoritolerans]|uniref:hypothetical protein n=1 Tax=Peribacillus frigoritolerans TaxID=450367 RepID=UPI0025A2E74F|nr:hypothetical protein [Peribacillus frigoritolerans]MDM5309709.1 hypothetical protein [Peribacillus frigoritolerans]